ncbi:PCC domain-containing protein [Streptomyces sp. KR80]|uniref:PCC domain-containing protein n=1 Tax=Streptomyces sp. KR80 TaxID=3457426 RepID=UPI003FD54D20
MTSDREEDRDADGKTPRQPEGPALITRTGESEGAEPRPRETGGDTVHHVHHMERYAVGRHTDLLEALRELAESGYQNGVVFRAVGTITSFTLLSAAGTATEYDTPGVLSAAGSIVGGRITVHATVGVEDNRAVSGYLQRALTGDDGLDLYLEYADD